MLRAVPDTNILISALMFGGLPGEFLELAFLQSPISYGSDWKRTRSV
jgi:predicted nucleic acid-binding protein